MEMTRRQFALSIAAATTLRSSLFEPTLSPVGVARGVVPGRVTWKHDPAAVTWDGTGSWRRIAPPNVPTRHRPDATACLTPHGLKEEYVNIDAEGSLGFDLCLYKPVQPREAGNSAREQLWMQVTTRNGRRSTALIVQIRFHALSRKADSECYGDVTPAIAVVMRNCPYTSRMGIH
jgi:hypothetical protein